MSLRARLLLAFALTVFVPLALLAFGFRYEVTRRLNEAYGRQLEIVSSAVDDEHLRLIRALGLRSAMTVPNRNPRSSTGRRRSTRAGSMNSRLAASSNVVAHSTAWPAAVKQPVIAPAEHP